MAYAARSRRWKGVIFGGLLVAVSACGPSYQTIYEGDVHFEHCYALDENPNVVIYDKSGCWADYVEHYRYGQTRDRVQYAAKRQAALSHLPEAPTDEAMAEAAPGENQSNGPTVNAPTPVDAFRPPPMTMNPDGGLPETPRLPNKITPNMRNSVTAHDATTGAHDNVNVPPPDVPMMPSAGCSDNCSSSWHSCRTSCSDGACPACDKSYRACMRGCFK